MKKKIPVIFLVLVIGYTLIPFFHTTVSSSKQVYREGEQAVFTISNKSLFDGKISNVGWVVEKKTDGNWDEVRGPSTYTMGLLLVLPSRYEKTHRFELKGFEQGEYRYGRAIKIFGVNYWSYTKFSVN